MPNKTLPDDYKVVTIRLPPALDKRLGAVATRDANTVASVIRRLLCAGLRDEERGTSGDRG